MMDVKVKTFRLSKYNSQHISMNLSSIEFMNDTMHVKVKTF